jgi:hypothetical protein
MLNSLYLLIDYFFKVNGIKIGPQNSNSGAAPNRPSAGAGDKGGCC